MRTFELTEQQTKFINNVITNGDNNCTVIDAVNFAIESWYLGLPAAEEDPVYNEFREHFLKKVIGYKSERTDGKYGTALNEKIGEFYNQYVNDKYKNIKAFTYGFLEGLHTKDNPKFGENEQCDCDYGFEDYQWDVMDLILDSLKEEFEEVDLWDWTSQFPIESKQKKRVVKSKKSK
jgi:hypothetical protein